MSRKNYSNITVRPYEEQDLEKITAIWNESFGSKLSPEQAKQFFSAQIYCGAAQYKGEVSGVYILRSGRSGTAAKAVYAVAKAVRGKGVGHVMAEHSLFIAKRKGFTVLELENVAASNRAALALYNKLGFESKNTDDEGRIVFCHRL